MNMHVPALQRSLPDVVAEYDKKLAELQASLDAFKRAGTMLKMSACVAGVYGDTTIDTGDVCLSTLKTNLLKSAWKHVYEGLQIDRIASAQDKAKWRSAIEKPAPFTLDNIGATFGDYILNPRGNILRGLAEVFCGLDRAFKSHDLMKIGVKGLPKRVILSGCGRYSTYGRDKVESILNALAAYQGKPLVDRTELTALFDNEDALLKAGTLTKYDKTKIHHPARGVRLRTFSNGNGHLFFEPDTLRDVNKALAEFYGEVLPDTTDEKPAQKQASTAVAKDLQFYGTPAKVAKDILEHRFGGDYFKGKRVLEPSCGEGALMVALRNAGARDVYGVEVDGQRAARSRALGFTVLNANFLETAFDKPLFHSHAKFDFVFMNPPFYGKHYVKHVLHAWSLLAPGGTLVAILPATARYDHGLLDELVKANCGRWSNPWDDLPVGSFSESGTNINTTVLTLHKREEAK